MSYAAMPDSRAKVPFREDEWLRNVVPSTPKTPDDDHFTGPGHGLLLMGGHQPFPKKSTSELPSPVFGVIDTHSESFQVIIACFIVANAATLGLETDMPKYSMVWNPINNLFTVVFLSELLLRLAQDGPKAYLCSMSNCLDVALVVAGVFDCWLAPVFMPNRGSGQTSQLFQIVRVARLARVLRVLRIFKMFRTLSLLAAGIAQALAAVGWVAFVSAIFVYVTAILLTNMIGHRGDYFENSDEIVACYSGQCPQNMMREEVDKWFGSVGNSMYTLFMCMTLANWPLVVDVVNVHFPQIQIVMVVFIFMTSYVLMSLITAVITDKMIVAVQNDHERRLETLEEDRKEFLDSLETVFEALDTNADGCLERDEFEKAIANDPTILQECELLGLGSSRGSMRTTEDTMMKLFDMVSAVNTETGKQGIEAGLFVKEFSRLTGKARAEDVLFLQLDVGRVDAKVKKIEAAVGSTNTAVAQITEKVGGFDNKLMALSNKVDKVDEQIASILSMQQKILLAIQPKSGTNVP